MATKHEDIIVLSSPITLEGVMPGSLSCVPNSDGRRGDCHDWLRDHEGENRVVWAFTNVYAYAAPSHEAVLAIRDFCTEGVLEMGAGLGYWAHVMRSYGINVVAYEPRQPHDNPYFSNHASEIFSYQTPWTTMKTRLEPGELEETPRALMLCWPDTNAFASHTLGRYRGNHLVFVGEGRGLATGDDDFHDAMKNEWVEERRIDLPILPPRLSSLRLLRRAETA